jgi:2-amino-4-hydroxy-6-hydroxymethyldihydropteridine diphosphokinase
VEFQGGNGNMIIIALGSNLSSKFGPPKSALRRAIQELTAAGIRTIRTSNLYETEAHAYISQPNFLNAAITVDTPLPAHTLLQVLKRIEAEAGRGKEKSGRVPYFLWKPRPLDLDIVSYKGLVCNWRACRPCADKRVILPHPRVHERNFVLSPVAAVAPEWHHPVFGLTAAQLLKKPAVRATGRIISSESFF